MLWMNFALPADRGVIAKKKAGRIRRSQVDTRASLARISASCRNRCADDRSKLRNSSEEDRKLLLAASAQVTNSIAVVAQWLDLESMKWKSAGKS